ncbi:MAG: hypothetical protein AAF063_30625 [Cyanobacteria bacterium J06643_5]
MFGLSVKPFFGFLVASLMGFTFAAPSASANPLSKFGSAYENQNPTCNIVPVTNTLELDTKEKENDSGSQKDSSKTEQHENNTRKSKKSGSAGIWKFKAKGESSSESSGKRDFMSETGSESDWNRDKEFSQEKKETENVDIGARDCDSYNEFGAKRDTALFTSIAQIETAKTQASRDENIAFINADMKKNVNYEQQVTHRLAIKTSADVKMSELNMQSNFALAQFYSHLDLKPQGGQQ